MLSLRQIRRRIKSVENTKKMTRAMEMVAAAKLKKLQNLLKQSDGYIRELRRILETLVREMLLAHPLLEKRPETKSILAFVVSSDTGLCGSYNTNIMDTAWRFLQTAGSPVHFVVIGKQAASFMKRKHQTMERELTVPRLPEIEATISEVAQLATNSFQNHKFDQIVFMYTKVYSLGSMKPVVEQVFPIASQTPDEKINTTVDYIIEPSTESILDIMLPEFIEAQMNQFVKHALVAEQASRMMAMRQATDSAKDMIESLTLARNKARQASITKELIEVVSGSRALHA